MRNALIQRTKTPFLGLLLSVCLGIFIPQTARSAGFPLGAASGERLSFNVRWMGLSAGDATMDMDITPKGHYVAQTAFSTSGLVRLLHALDESMIAKGLSDFGIFHAQLFTKEQRRPNKVKVTTYQFDKEMQQVVSTRRETGHKKAVRQSIPLDSEQTLDPISGFYALRAWPALLPNTNLQRLLVDGDTVYCVTITVGGTHRLTLSLGQFTVFPVTVTVANSAQFLLHGNTGDKKGSIVIWLTDDMRRMPVRVEAQIALGSVVAELVSFDDGQGEKKSMQHNTMER